MNNENLINSYIARQYEFNEEYMVTEPYYAKEYEKVTNDIVNELISGKKLTTNDIFEKMLYQRFSELTVKAIYAMVARKLIKLGMCLVCYPHIDINKSDPTNIHIDKYIYQAVAIEVPKRY